MAQVTVSIAGRTYRMACGEGEEPRLEELARAVDAKIGELRGSFGEIGDQRITVMTALTFADELSEARRRLDEMAAQVERQREAMAAMERRGEDHDRAVAQALAAASERIETVAAQMRES